jgi:hypothetical protein
MDKMIQTPFIYTVVANIKGGEKHHMSNEQEHQEQ